MDSVFVLELTKGNVHCLLLRLNGMKRNCFLGKISPDDDSCSIEVSVFFIREWGWVLVSLYLGLVTYYVIHVHVQEGNTQAF